MRDILLFKSGVHVVDLGGVAGDGELADARVEQCGQPARRRRVHRFTARR